MSTPRVSFVMPAYNAARTIGEAIESVLGQTFGDWELIVIDDASTDETRDVVDGYRESRVRVVRNETNQEIARALNRGVKMAAGEFVARLDADDMSLPGRCARQVKFLEERGEVAVVGADIETFTEAGERAVVKYPPDAAYVAAALVFRNSLAHPAVMWRREVLAGRGLWYDERIRRAQDYDLWARCTAAGLTLANVPEVLVRYRLHAGQATVRESAGSLATARAVRRGIIARIGIAATESEMDLHEALSLNQLDGRSAWVQAAGSG